MSKKVWKIPVTLDNCSYTALPKASPNSSEAILLIPSVNNNPRPENTFPIIGMKLSNRNVLVVSNRACNAGKIFCPKANCPSTFCAAAFMAEKEPLKVEAASFAVVPVISRFSWIAWMAL